MAVPKVPQAARKTIQGIWAWLDLKNQVGKALGALVAVTILSLLWVYFARVTAFMAREVPITFGMAIGFLSIAYIAGLMTTRGLEWWRKKKTAASNGQKEHFALHFAYPANANVSTLKITWDVRWEDGKVAGLSPYCGLCGERVVKISDHGAGSLNPFVRFHCPNCSAKGDVPGLIESLECEVRSHLHRLAYSAQTNEYKMPQ